MTDMKIIKLSLLFVILCAGASFPDVSTVDLAYLINDLNKIIGEKYYILKNTSSKNEVTVVIFKRYDVSFNGRVTYHEYPSDMIKFLTTNMNKAHNFKVNFEISPYVPPAWIDESIRKEQIKYIIILSVVGVIAILFVVYIIARSRGIKPQSNIQPLI
jgi:hypothetical protein